MPTDIYLIRKHTGFDGGGGGGGNGFGGGPNVAGGGGGGNGVTGFGGGDGLCCNTEQQYFINCRKELFK